jgi:predicted NAD/FAD-binding protein
VVESLNPVRTIRPECILGEFEYSHPVFDLAAIQAQQRVRDLQGIQHTWYCGAWTGYGFHEDGLKSGLSVAQALLDRTAGSRKAAA